VTKKKIPEIRYRASRICRILGNPTAYEALHILSQGPRTPEQLAQELGVSMPTISQVLRALRNIDLVRYEVFWRSRKYSLKLPETDRALRVFEDLVKKIEKMR
jgi:DNA-binding transcriptional ArsR family regulator